MTDALLKFLFDRAPVRAEAVRLREAWRQMIALHDYPPPVARLLGEMTAAAALLATTIKFNGALILQIHGDGPVKLMVVECQPDLALRATAKLRSGFHVPDEAGLRELVNANGNGRCAITLDPASSAGLAACGTSSRPSIRRRKSPRCMPRSRAHCGSGSTVPARTSACSPNRSESGSSSLTTP